MYNNQKISAIKTQSQKDWSKGSVIIKDKTINLDPMCYLKREKIINNQGQWIDTKALNISDNLSRDKLED
jgi:hypothetical protein